MWRNVIVRREGHNGWWGEAWIDGVGGGLRFQIDDLRLAIGDLVLGQLDQIANRQSRI